MALALRTDGIPGISSLRTLGEPPVAAPSQRPLRARSRPWIERWLREIVAAAALEWRIAREIALCGRLIKGYGATNLRGKANLLHILDHVVAGDTHVPVEKRAEAIRDAREAALAEEGGSAFDEALVRHGAPPLPAKPQPIRWMGKPPGSRPSPKGHAS